MTEPDAENLIGKMEEIQELIEKQELIAEKRAMYLEMPEELLMEYGIIPDTRPALPPLSRRARFRWWRSRQREQLASWLFRRIAGYDVPGEDEDW